MIVIRVKTPQECSAEEKKDFIEKVQEGGAVDPKTLPRLVDRAKFLAFCYEETNCLGVGGIKVNDDHRNRIFENAKSKDIREQYKIELGWIIVDLRLRGQGVGKTIVRELLGKVKSDKIYATTSNDGMKRILESFNFHQSGEEYPSDDGKRSLALFVRDC